MASSQPASKNLIGSRSRQSVSVTPSWHKRMPLTIPTKNRNFSAKSPVAVSTRVRRGSKRSNHPLLVPAEAGPVHRHVHRSPQFVLASCGVHKNTHGSSDSGRYSVYPCDSRDICLETRFRCPTSLRAPATGRGASKPVRLFLERSAGWLVAPPFNSHSEPET